jgi:cyclase
VLRRRVIPCLDVRGGRLVKGVRFRQLRDCGDPVDAAERYAAAGADEIVWLNIAADAEGWQELLRAVERAAERVDIPLTVGGGIDRPERARELLLAGADKISVNSAALRTPELIDELAERLGSQCVVVAMDAARGDGDIVAALQAGADAALAATIFHDGETTPDDVKREVAACGLPARV